MEEDSDADNDGCEFDKIVELEDELEDASTDRLLVEGVLEMIPLLDEYNTEDGDNNAAVTTGEGLPCEILSWEVFVLEEYEI
jgi:hypothetical protein